MNTYLFKDNLFKNGEYGHNHSEAMAKEKRRSKVPTTAQAKYRDELYKFCVQTQLRGKDGWRKRGCMNHLLKLL